MNGLGRALVVVGIALLAGAPSAVADEWELLGKQDVMFRGERDAIAVTAAEGRFDRIKLQVVGNGVELGEVTVHYGNGETQELAVRQFVEAGGETRAIDLPGEARVIKKVEFVYRARGRKARGRATLRLFGRRVGGAAGAKAADDEKKPVWVTLGAKVVAFRTDRDVIPVTAQEGRFRKIKLEVHDSGIEVLDLEVNFGNGETQDVQVRSFIERGGETRVIDLPGEARVIKSIELVYRTPKARVQGDRAKVVVHGLQEDHGAGAKPNAKPGEDRADDGQGWELLGLRQVNFRADRDVIPVTAREGRFTKIKLKVLENGLEITGARVYFANGSDQEVEVREHIKAGGETRVIDLPGEARVIQKIELRYRTRGGQGGRAVVKVFGRQK